MSYVQILDLSYNKFSADALDNFFKLTVKNGNL